MGGGGGGGGGTTPKNPANLIYTYSRISFLQCGHDFPAM
jgi:hypothetical protein